MLRQLAPPDPSLLLPPLPTAEVIPRAVATTRGGLVIEFGPPPAPPVASTPQIRAAVPERSAPVAVLEDAVADRPAAALWPEPVPTFTGLMGAAGSGKTFATRAWAEEDPGLVLCATTGIAAINLGGETINSILGYFDTASLKELYEPGHLTSKLGRLWRSGVTRLVIDEVSMLSGDQLSFLVRAIEEVNDPDYILRSKGHVNVHGEPPQMGLTLVGDFCQLSPVRAPFAFEADEWNRFAPHIRTLTEIRRQDDAEFIAVLRAARCADGKFVVEYFADRKLIQHESDDDYEGSTILATNASVEHHNQMRMSQLTTETVTFTSSRWGKQRSEWGNPDKPPSTWGIPETLSLKIGALVMVLANRRVTLDPDDPTEKTLIYVNGDLGELVGAGEEVAYYTPDGQAVRKRVAYVRLQRTGAVENVFPVERQVKIPADAARRKQLRLTAQEDKVDNEWEIVGGITYMPLRVAYATTVHKSQGLSLDRVQINVRDPFFEAPGMIYVALSRARTAAGVRLVGSPRALIARCTSDPKVKEWL